MAFGRHSAKGIRSARVFSCRGVFRLQRQLQSVESLRLTERLRSIESFGRQGAFGRQRVLVGEESLESFVVREFSVSVRSLVSKGLLINEESLLV
jgi:hypothetical protein